MTTATQSAPPKEPESTSVKEENDLSKRNMKQLRLLAKELKLKNYSSLVKVELIGLILTANDTYYDGTKTDKIVGKKATKAKKTKEASESKKAIGGTITPKEIVPKPPKDKKKKEGKPAEQPSTKPSNMKDYK
tara:strand:+ start:113 stop:511 length:399 start_codon:yes stop_codon:yes gene_type:complete